MSMAERRFIPEMEQTGNLNYAFEVRKGIPFENLDDVRSAIQRIQPRYEAAPSWDAISAFDSVWRKNPLEGAKLISNPGEQFPFVLFIPNDPLEKAIAHQLKISRGFLSSHVRFKVGIRKDGTIIIDLETIIGVLKNIGVNTDLSGA